MLFKIIVNDIQLESISVYSGRAKYSNRLHHLEELDIACTDFSACSACSQRATKRQPQGQSFQTNKCDTQSIYHLFHSEFP